MEVVQSPASYDKFNGYGSSFQMQELEGCLAVGLEYGSDKVFIYILEQFYITILNITPGLTVMKNDINKRTWKFYSVSYKFVMFKN